MSKDSTVKADGRHQGTLPRRHTFSRVCRTIISKGLRWVAGQNLMQPFGTYENIECIQSVRGTVFTGCIERAGGTLVCAEWFQREEIVVSVWEGQSTSQELLGQEENTGVCRSEFWGRRIEIVVRDCRCQPATTFDSEDSLEPGRSLWRGMTHTKSQKNRSLVRVWHILRVMHFKFIHSGTPGYKRITLHAILHFLRSNFLFS